MESDRTPIGLKKFDWTPIGLKKSDRTPIGLKKSDRKSDRTFGPESDMRSPIGLRTSPIGLSRVRVGLAWSPIGVDKLQKKLLNGSRAKSDKVSDRTPIGL